MLYLDVWKKGDKNWKRIAVDDLTNDGSEKFITWQRYISIDVGQYGAVYGNLVFDFDDNDNPERARKDANILLSVLLRQGIKEKNIRIYFSGKKGFHIEIDYRSYMDTPAHNLHLIYKTYYLENKKKLPTMDGSVYSIRKQWRMVNTKHSGSGLYCIQITKEELGKSIEALRLLASKPREINSEEFIIDSNAKSLYERMQTRYYKSVDEYKKRVIKIRDIDINGVPPCVMAKINQRGLTTNRNNILFENACSLRALGVDIDKTKDILQDFIIGNNYSLSSANKSIESAYNPKIERKFSCIENSYYCNKEICNALMDTTESKQISDFNKRFGIKSQHELIKDIEKELSEGYYEPVMQTGIDNIDNKCPILKDHVLVVSANSNQNKTSFLITIIKNNPEKKCLFYSVEEGEKRGALRLNYAEYYGNSVMHVVKYDNNPITEKDIRMGIKIYKPDYVVIDQLINLQQEKSTQKEERLKYKHLMEQFREIARELNTPLIMAHQMNREAITSDVPIKEQIAEGADIERLAYDVWILFRRKINGSYYNMINIAKTKMYTSNVVIPVTFDPKTYTICNFQEEIPEEMIKKYGVDVELMNGKAREIAIKKQGKIVTPDWVNG